jgi:hypothetical protein
MKALLTALAAVAALCLAACGSSGSSSAPQSPYQAALTFSQCMRTHGEPGFPDPDSQGNYIITSNEIVKGTQLDGAISACHNLTPPGFTLNNSQQQQDLSTGIKYAQCMRSHGITSFPDPEAGGAKQALPAGVDPNSPQFRAAQQACRSLTLPGGKS